MEKTDPMKINEPNPQPTLNPNFTNPNTNSETLKSFYTNLMSNTPSNQRGGPAPTIKSAFDVNLIKK